MRLLSRVLVVALLALVATGCGGEESVAPTHTLSPSGTPASQAGTPAPTPTLSPTPELHPLISGRKTLQGIVTTDTGEDIRVSLSKAGGPWRFESGERWLVTRADGTVIMSGIVVGEALQYESVFGFVRLDDGRVIAYEFAGDWGHWSVYPAEEVCRALGQSIEVPAGYIKDGAIEEELLVKAVCRERAPGALEACRDKTTGVVRGLAICLEDLGIKEDIQIVP
jgi:hypothetical protein